MTGVDYGLWVLAFLGVAVIYGGSGVVRKITKKEVTGSVQIVIKTIGVVLSAVAMVLLYKMNRLI